MPLYKKNCLNCIYCSKATPSYQGKEFIFFLKDYEREKSQILNFI